MIPPLHVWGMTLLIAAMFQATLTRPSTAPATAPAPPPLAANQPNSAIVPISRGDEPWWQERHDNVNQLAREGNIDLIFIGDSITQGWEGEGKEVWRQRFATRKSLNLGFSGDM